MRPLVQARYLWYERRAWRCYDASSLKHCKLSGNVGYQAHKERVRLLEAVVSERDRDGSRAMLMYSTAAAKLLPTWRNRQTRRDPSNRLQQTGDEQHHYKLVK